MMKIPFFILCLLLSMLTGVLTSADKSVVYEKINIPIKPDIGSKLKILEGQKVNLVSFLQEYGVAFGEGAAAVLVEQPAGNFYISSTNSQAENRMIKAVCAWLSEYSPWFTAEMLITSDESVAQARYLSIFVAADAASQKKSN